MPSTPRIKVLPIFPGLLGQAWPFVGPLLLRGELECTPAGNSPESQMHGALNGLLAFVLKAHRGECIVWSIIDESKRKVIAALITEIRAEDGVKRLWVSRMAGEDIFTWGKALKETMAAHARQQGATAVRFWGRKALQRAYGDCSIIHTAENGTHLFEGADA